MTNNTKTLEVKILDRELRIACPVEERGELLDAVHELLGTKVGRGIDLSDFRRRIDTMQTAIDSALAEQDKLF